MIIQKLSLLIGGLVLALALVTGSAQAQNYRSYAAGLVSHPPAGVQIRPDLEALLDRLASSYRRSRGRVALGASDELREAARAQAIDMMRQGKSGHRSSRGETFDSRFASYVGNIELYRAKGENAASDRRPDPAGEDKAKRLFKSWLDSSGHRQNLVQADYLHVSTGVVQRGDELWAVQIFWSDPAENSLLLQ